MAALTMPGAGHGPTVAGVPVKINMRSAVPTYRQLADELRRLISDGELGPGDKLPSLHELVRETGLSSNTIRAAFRVLKDEGLVVTAPGRGVFVSER
jgi:GntR family transcriptional regulator